jgi:hypothetical protein
VVRAVEGGAKLTVINPTKVEGMEGAGLSFSTSKINRAKDFFHQ